jgi:hypothetical protein
VLRSTGVKVIRRWREGPEGKIARVTPSWGITGILRNPGEKIVSTYCILIGAGAFAIVVSSRSLRHGRVNKQKAESGTRMDARSGEVQVD